jgi:DNA-binding MarR family transcriptional regulator
MVSMAINILRSLSHENMSTNQLIEQTSSDKSFVVNTIKALNKAKIIKRTRDHEHRQKKINELDSHGQEILKIICCIEQYTSSYRVFIKSFRGNFDVSKSDAIRSREFAGNILNGKGPNDHNTDKLDEHYEEIGEVITLCIRNICNILIYIYALSSHITTTDKLLQAIINRIILDSFSEQISACREGAKMVGLHTNFIVPVIDSLVGDNIGLNLFSKPLIGMETKNLVRSLLNLFVIPSGEENLSTYTKKYFPKYPENPKFKPREDVLKRYDAILKEPI